IVEQVGYRRLPAVQGIYQRRSGGEPQRLHHGVALEIGIVQAVAAAENQLGRDLESHAYARLNVVPVRPGRRGHVAVYAGELNPAREIGKPWVGRNLRRGYLAGDRIGNGSVEAYVHPVVAFGRRCVEVEPESEIQSQPVIHLPVVLQPRSDIPGLVEYGR